MAQDVKDLLREFIVSSTELAAVSCERRELGKQQREARRLLSEWQSAQGAQGAQGAPRVCTPLPPGPDGKPRYLTTSVGTPKLCLSDKTLLAVADGLTPNDFDKVKQELSDTDMVPVRQLLAQTLLARLTEPTKPSTRVLKRKPRGAVEIPLESLDEQQRQWVEACVAPLPATAPLRKVTTELATRLQGSMPGADDPDFARPLVVNVSETEQRRMVLRARTSVRRQTLTRDTLLEFLDKMQHDMLERRVNATTADIGELCALSKRIMPALLRAIQDWRAQHSTTSTSLVLAPDRSA